MTGGYRRPLSGRHPGLAWSEVLPRVSRRPAVGQNRLHDLWGTADDESLRRRLLSFLAVESLHESYRMSALALTDTSSRLQHALSGLEARKAALVAEVALRRAL